MCVVSVIWLPLPLTVGVPKLLPPLVTDAPVKAHVEFGACVKTMSPDAVMRTGSGLKSTRASRWDYM